MLAELCQTHTDGGLAQLQPLSGLGHASRPMQLADDSQQLEIDVCQNQLPLAGFSQKCMQTGLPSGIVVLRAEGVNQVVCQPEEVLACELHERGR